MVRSRLVLVAVPLVVAACGSTETDGGRAVEPSSLTAPPSTAVFIPDPSSTITTPVDRPECSTPVEPGEWHLDCISGDPDAHVSVDGDELAFRFVGGAEYVADDACTDDYRAELDETTREVRVRIWTKSGVSQELDYACADVGYLRTVTARLARPLGERTVRFDPDDVEADVSDVATVATAHWLPKGREASPPAPFRDGGWERVFEARRSPGYCGPDDALLVLYQGPPSLLDTLRPPGDRPVSTHAVRGAQASFWLGGGFPTAQLRWIENGQGLVLTSDAPCDNTEPVPLPTMLRIARHFTVPPR